MPKTQTRHWGKKTYRPRYTSQVSDSERRRNKAQMDEEYDRLKYKTYTIPQQVAAEKIYNNWLKIQALKNEEISDRELDEDYFATHMSSRPRKYTSIKNSIRGGRKSRRTRRRY